MKRLQEPRASTDVAGVDATGEDGPAEISEILDDLDSRLDSASIRAVAAAILKALPGAVHISIVQPTAPAALRIYPLAPHLPMHLCGYSPQALWDDVFLNGTTLVRTGDTVRDLVRSQPIFTTAIAKHDAPAAFVIVPLIAKGYINGAVVIGLSNESAWHTDSGPAIVHLLHQLAQSLVDAEQIESALPTAQEETRRKVLARLLHDLRTPLSGIGLAAELIELDPTSVPQTIMDAIHIHYSDIMRYMSELEDFVFIDLDPRLPTARPVILADVLEIVLWRVRPYTRRRSQKLRVTGHVDRPMLISEHHLDQALTAAAYDVSVCASEGSLVAMRLRSYDTYATISIEGNTDRPIGDIGDSLMNPHLRAHSEGPLASLMSLAAGARALTHYKGGLTVTSRAERLAITFTVPLTPSPDHS